VHCSLNEPEEEAAMLAIEQLKVNYGETKILFDINLKVAKGEIVCLMGRNGVGKTTLLNTVMGLLRPRGGKITFGDRDLTGVSAYQRARSGIGYVPQGRGIFPGLTVYENLLIGLEACSAKGTNAGRSAAQRGRNEPAAVDRALTIFPALKPILARKGGNLSGGQQQQLAFARALIAEPVLLLLDEPTEGIQPSIIDQIGELLLRIKSSMKIAVLLVEQYVDFAINVSDRYYFMETGAIVATGLIPELTDEIICKNMEI
jgi:urea transport system ATP-binding protein